jgi:hypothetical protein
MVERGAEQRAAMKAASELTVSVRVAPSDAPPPPEVEPALPEEWVAAPSDPVESEQQQQQQQQ